LLERHRRLVPGAEVGALVRPELADLCRLAHPDLAVNDLDWLRGRRVLFVNARWLPPDGPFEVPDADAAGLVGDRPAYALASDGEAAGWPWRSAELPEGLPGRPAGGVLLGYLWHLVAGNGAALEQDWRRWRTGSVGPHCRVGGEVEASILLGHVNKYHDGFLGHSYLGEWVNVGAGTQFSDLRNDYGTIRMPVGGRAVDSGQIKIGAYVGDFT